MITPDRAYSTSQAAEFLGVSTKKVQVLINTGQLPGAFAHYKADCRTVDSYRVPGHVIRAYISQRTIAA